MSYFNHKYKVPIIQQLSLMNGVDDLIPDYFIERSLAFKTGVIIVGALLLLTSSFTREYLPIVWIIPFLAGALIEWLVVATVYIEMSEIEDEINHVQREIQDTADEIRETREEITIAQQEINQTKEDVFSFSSGSQGGGVRNSLEDRISQLENETGMDSLTVLPN
jgi:uncharacterized protein YlxW (UPF0749 family)